MIIMVKCLFIFLKILEIKSTADSKLYTIKATFSDDKLIPKNAQMTDYLIYHFVIVHHFYHDLFY